jgi:peptidoglycan biosynthesis protein MviN/MurJ (putative lipid II flippase)
MMIELFRKLFSNGQLDSAFLMIGAYAVGKSQDHNFLYFIKETFHMCVEFIGSHVQVEFAAPIN